jgi:hypothetical protein
LIYGRAGRLDDENVSAPDVILDLAMHLTVRKFRDHHAPGASLPLETPTVELLVEKFTNF